MAKERNPWHPIFDHVVAPPPRHHSRVRRWGDDGPEELTPEQVRSFEAHEQITEQLARHPGTRVLGLRRKPLEPM